MIEGAGQTSDLPLWYVLRNVFERVFEIAPVFRPEKHDTSGHLNEYNSVDFEMGYINSFEKIMEIIFMET